MYCRRPSSVPRTPPNASGDRTGARASLRRRASKEAESFIGSRAPLGTAAHPAPTGPGCFLLWMVAQQEARSRAPHPASAATAAKHDGAPQRHQARAPRTAASSLPASPSNSPRAIGRPDSAPNALAPPRATTICDRKSSAD